MTTRTTSLSSASTFEHEGDLLSELRQPLVEVSKMEEQNELPGSTMSVAAFKCCSIFMGMVVGLLILLSTLGLNYLAMQIWGPSMVLTKSNFWVVWCAMTSFLALLLLAVHRHIVTVTFYPTLDEEASDDAESNHRKRVMNNMENLVLHLEGWFVAGALTGVCLAWVAFDLLFGRVNEALHTLMVLFFALMWCRFVVFVSTTLFAWHDKLERRCPSSDDALVTVV